MSRKLHNTLMAVIASSSLLTLGLIAGTPVISLPHAAVAQSAFATLGEATALPDSAAKEGEAASTKQRGHTQAVRGNRQSVSMPFFSFAPRG